MFVVIPVVIPLKETSLGIWTVPICLSIVSMMLLSVVFVSTPVGVGVSTSFSL